MGETGKRFRANKNNDGNSKNQRRRIEKDDSGRGELVVYRILCPDGVIGSVIGKGGKVINSIRQETGARVKVVDPFPGAKDRVITVYCYVKEKEEVEVDGVYGDRQSLCPAQDALLKLHAVISQSLATLVDSDKKGRDKEECNILVPASQSANIIGKSGTIIKKLRNKTNANIKIASKDVSDPTHSCALGFDNFVQITGVSEAVKKALFAVSTIIYKFAAREEIPLDATVPEAPPTIIIPSDISLYPGAGFYGGVDSADPSRSLHPLISASMPEYQGYTDNGSAWPPLISASVAHGYGGTSAMEKLVIRVLCPSDMIGRVIGKGGMTIKSIRQASGAVVDVVDNKGRGDDSLVTVTASESVDDLKSMAVEAVLLLQEKIIDEGVEVMAIRLLVPSKVIGCIIGKSGSIIHEIRNKSQADVRITKSKIAKHSDSDDELIEVAGHVVNVRDALVQIVLRLRDDVLKSKDNGHNPSAAAEPLHPSLASLQLPPTLPSFASLGFEQGRESGTRLSRLYGYEPLPMGDSSYESAHSYPAPSYAAPSYAAPSYAAPSYADPSYAVPSSYATPSSYAAPSYAASSYPASSYPTSSYAEQDYGRRAAPTTAELVIPAGALVKVTGKGGANLANIRQISGAVVEISESVTSRGDRLALISGTTEQKRSAENLIQAFIMSS